MTNLKELKENKGKVETFWINETLSVVGKEIDEYNKTLQSLQEISRKTKALINETCNEIKERLQIPKERKHD